MYSRATRKFSTDAQDPYPNVSPGQYHKDIRLDIVQRGVGTPSYAPFSTLAPKISVFEEVPRKNPIPAPGTYETDHSAVIDAKGAPMFGKSAAPRFVSLKSMDLTPGPNAYQRPLRGRPHANHSKAVAAVGEKGAKAVAALRGLSISRMSISEGRTQPVRPTTSGGGKTTVTVMRGQHPRVIKRMNSGVTAPPSIPSPLKSLGFTEDPKTGRLVPRNAKHKNATPLQSPLGKSERRRSTQSAPVLPREPRGLKFAEGLHSGHDVDQFLIQPTGGKGGNLTSKPRRPQEGTYAAHKKALREYQEVDPSPNMYNVDTGLKYLSTNAGALKMGDVAVPRFFENFEKQKAKESVPAPGVYHVPSTAEHLLLKIVEGKVNMKSSTAPRFSEKPVEGPSPNTYNVKNGSVAIPESKLPVPFGASAKRFENPLEKPSTDAKLGPGVYKADKVTTMRYETLRRVATCSPTSRTFSYGKSERELFQPLDVPGPGQYEVSKRIGTPHHPNRQHKYSISPPHPVEGMTNVPYIPDRFEKEKFQDLPPPGAYNLARAHEKVQDHGKIPIQSSFKQEEFFNVAKPPPVHKEEKRDTVFDHIEGYSPGPQWYEQKGFLEDKVEHNRYLAEGAPSKEKAIGFLARAPRVPDSVLHAMKAAELPSPMDYNVKQHELDTNVKKTFNVTLSHEKPLP